MHWCIVLSMEKATAAADVDRGAVVPAPPGAGAAAPSAAGAGAQPTARSPEKRRRSATRERLLDGALQVFAEVGFEAASVEDICARAGFTRGAFYSSFRSKDELFLALFRKQTERLVAAVSEALADIENPIDLNPADLGDDGIGRYLALATLDRSWLVVNAEFTLYALRHPEAAAARAEHNEWIATQLAGLLERLFTAKGRPLLVDPVDLARILVVLHLGSATEALLAPSTSSLVDVEQQILPILVHAVTGGHPQVGPAADPTTATAAEAEAATATATKATDGVGDGCVPRAAPAVLPHPPPDWPSA